MLELRLYRAGLLLALAAAVVLMFSVVSRPSPLRSDVAADAFDGERAAALDRQLLDVALDRTPGSRGDAAAQRSGGSASGAADRARNCATVAR